MSNFHYIRRIELLPNIIVIDDDKNIRLLYKKELDREGYEVSLVASAKDALEEVIKKKYRVAIIDIEMPDMSGLELISQIKELSPHTMTILNSAYSIYKSDFKSWMADAYVIKSSDIEPLKQKIKELIDIYDDR